MASSASGPSGGSGGNAFSDLSSVVDGVQLSGIEVRAGAVIDAVRFAYRHGSDDVPTAWHGGDGGQRHQLPLRSGEHLVRLRGTYGLFPGFGQVVQSLTIDTDQRERALHAGGGGGGGAFVYEAGRGLEIAGLAGSSGTVLDAIGAIYRPRPEGRNGDLFRSGPSGGEGGSGFNDAADLQRMQGLNVARLVVHADRFVDSISTHYAAPDGRTVGGHRHGGDGGIAHELVLGPGEFISAVEGRFGTLVDRIVIETNQRKQALAAGAHFRVLEPRSPFPAPYRYEAPDGAEIVGFFGRSGTFVDALGVICRFRSRS